MARHKLSNEIRYRLLAARLERDYAKSEDKGLSFGPPQSARQP